MPDKSPHEHHLKKPATKTLKEKRQKHAKEHEHDMSAASDAVQEAHKADQARKRDAWHQGDAAQEKH